MSVKLEEFQNINLKDKRLNDRFIKMLNSFLNKPTSSIPGSFKNIHETKASYRFFDNKKADSENILETHKKSTLERISNMKETKVLLVIQDTSDLNYSTHKSKKELGPTQNHIKHGLKIHPSLVTTEDRIPLGILHTTMWTREEDENNEDLSELEMKRKKKTERDKKPIEEKESYRWIESIKASKELAKQFPDKQIINLGDREADIYDIFAILKEEEESNLQYIIRSNYSRQTEEGLDFKAELSKKKSQGELIFTIRRNNKKRRIKQEIKYMEIDLKPPSGKKELGTVKINAILAEEMDVPKGEKPLKWILLTNKKITTTSEAIDVIEKYLARWEIEIYFKVLKSGCKIENIQLEKKSRLENCLCMYMIVAWRIMFLLKLGRECPDLPGEIIFSKVEMRCIYASLKKAFPKTSPKLGELIKLISQLGGYLNRKNDGPPGPKVLWEGTQRLYYVVVGYELSC